MIWIKASKKDSKRLQTTNHCCSELIIGLSVFFLESGQCNITQGLVTWQNQTSNSSRRAKLIGQLCQRGVRMPSFGHASISFFQNVLNL
jgi:hypothetical protein